jgi:hypothetical protein
MTLKMAGMLFTGPLGLEYIDLLSNLMAQPTFTGSITLQESFILYMASYGVTSSKLGPTS